MRKITVVQRVNYQKQLRTTTEFPTTISKFALLGNYCTCKYFNMELGMQRQQCALYMYVPCYANNETVAVQIAVSNSLKYDESAQ